MIDSIASTSSSPAAAVAKNTGAGSQDYFLKLLVAQMKNQDPLNPLDNAQVTSQMAQLNTVEGINKVASKLDALLSGTGATQSLQAAAIVGHTVLVPGTSLELANGQAVGGIELTGAADHVVVTVKDASGTVVHTADLGAQPQGTVNFAWDGSTDAGAAAAAGTYSFAVEAKAAGGKVVANTLTAGLVSSVTPTTDGAQLVVGKNLFALSQVRQIY